MRLIDLGTARASTSKPNSITSECCIESLEEINQSIILLKAVENAQFYSSELLRSKGKSESSASKALITA
jgi:hypothetical protein